MENKMSKIEYPITVQRIAFDTGEPLQKELLFGGTRGDYVSVRPCGEQYEEKTFLGVMLGGLALGLGVRWDDQNGTLTVTRHGYNPAIFVPDLGEVIMGRESWWGKIESAEQIREITDADINSVWYVKALKAFDQGEENKK